MCREERLTVLRWHDGHPLMKSGAATKCTIQLVRAFSKLQDVFFFLRAGEITMSIGSFLGWSHSDFLS